MIKILKNLYIENTKRIKNNLPNNLKKLSLYEIIHNKL